MHKIKIFFAHHLPSLNFLTNNDNLLQALVILTFVFDLIKEYFNKTIKSKYSHFKV